MKKNLLYSLILAFGALFLSTNVAWAQCASGQSEITISLDQSGDGFPDEDGWRLINVTDGITVDSACFGTYASNSGIVTITTCVDTGKTYVFYAYDDFGDGLDGASYTLSYSFGSSIGSLGTNNFNIPASLCNPAYSNNELCDSLSFSAIYVAAPACLPATALSASSIGSDSAILGWTENNSSTSWQIEWGASGFSQGTGTTIITGNNPYSITGLSPATAYDWYVRSICGPADTSIWSTVNTFTTSLQGPQGITCSSGNPGVIFSEDFEATGGWTGDINSGAESWIYDANGTPSSGTGPTAAYSGSQYVFVETSGAGVGTPVSLVSPAIDMNAGSLAAELSFWVHAFGPQIGTLSVGVGTSATGPFTSIFTYSGPIQAAQADPFQNVGADLTAYLGQTIYLEFLYTTNGGYQGDIAIDLVEITSCVNCPAPSALTATNIAADSATLGWTENGTSTNWQIEWGTTGFSQGSGTLVNTSSNPYNLTGLTPLTSYEFYVRSVCAPGDSSAWVGPFSFTTPCAVFVPNYSEDFATFLPSCWEEAADGSISTGPQNVGSGLWTNQTGGVTFGTTARINLYTTSRSEWLISPVFDLTGGPFELVVDAAVTNWNSTTVGDNMGSDDSVRVAISTDNGLTWTSIYVWDVNNQPPLNPTPYIIDLTAYSGTTAIFGILATDGPIDNSEDYDFHIGNFEVRIPPSCPIPTSLASSNITTTSADLAWTENGSATTWIIEYGASGFTQGSGMRDTVTVNPYTLSGLMSNTSYDWYVQSACGVNDSSLFSGPNSFTTPCSIFTAPYTESFVSGNLPACWTESSVSGDAWEYGGSVDFGAASVRPDAFGNTGEYANIDFSDDPDTTSIITPVVDITGLTIPRLTFYYNSQTTSTAFSPYNRLIVDYWNGSTWVNITVIDTLTTAGWTKYAFNVSSYAYGANLVQFRFSAQEGGAAIGGTGTSTFDQDLMLDEVVVEETPNCLVPTSLASANITSNSVDLSWVENNSATSWMISYGPTGFTPGSGTQIVASSNPYALTGLAHSTSYEWYVKSICGSGDTSGWSGPGSFLTLCGVNTAPFFDDVEAHSGGSPITSSLCWTASANNTSNDWGVSTNGTTPSSGTGPNSANSGTNFFFFEASGGATGNEALLTSPEIDVTSLTAPMIEFYYHMHGDNRGFMGDLYIDVYDGVTYTVVDSIKGEQQANQSDPFLRRQIALPGATGVIQVRFRAYRGTGAQWGDIAIDDIAVKEQPSCLSPTTLTASNVTSNSAIVSWVEPATATQWEISYDTAGFTAGNGMSVIANTNPDTLTGLASVTNYDWYVRSICAPGDTSSWSPMGSFTTACSVISAPLTESFDATTVPNCWSRYQATGSGWVFGTPGFTWNTQGCTSIPVDHTGNGGNFAAIDFSVPDAGVVLELPVVDVASLTAPYLQFFFTMCNSASGGNPNVLYIEAYDGTNWNIADSITQGTNGWQRFGYNISAYTYNTSLVRLRFRAEDGGGTQFYYDMGIDDVSIDNAPAADLGITAITAPTNGCGLSATETVTVEITNYGSAAQTGFSLVYSLDGVLVTPEVFTGSIAAGATANYSFTATANLSVAKSYDIVAYTQLTGDFDNTNDTSSTVVISAANISSFPYAESFESGPAGWIASGAISSWALGAPAGTIINSASDGTQAWVTNLTGAYLANETAALNSPCLDFTNVSNPYLRMDIWYDIESRWDGALVQASTDGGATWSTVGAQGDPVNWYNDTADVIAAKNIDPTGQSWTGDGTDNLPGSGGWISAGHALDNMGGLSSVNLRILFVSDGFVMTEGFAVDHVEIFDSIPMDPYYPIGTINTEDANGVADSLNVVCWTSGTVYGVDLDGNNGLSFHIIDMSSGSQEGINVFNFNDVSNYVVTEGDSIRIHGPVIQFNGLTELNVDSIEIIKTNAFLPQPNLVTDLDESTESQLVRLENLTVTAASSATASSVNYTVTNGTNTMTIRVDGDTDVHDSIRWVAGDTICNVIGIGGQFDNSNPYTSGYQLFPMRFQDIDTCLAIGIEKQVALADYAIYPNPSEGEFTLQTSGFNNSIVNLEIRDLNGRIIQDIQLNNAKSAQVTRINLNGVAKGIYFLAIQDGDTRKIEKLIVR